MPKGLGGSKSQRVVDELIDHAAKGTKITRDLLISSGMEVPKKALRSPKGGYKGNRVLVIYTDLEADDIFSIVCHTDYRRAELACPPIVVFTTEIEEPGKDGKPGKPGKDSGTIFAKKLVMTTAALGPDFVESLHIVSGGGHVPPPAPYNTSSREEVLGQAVERIRHACALENEKVECEWLVLAPGRGNLEFIMNSLQSNGDEWDKIAKSSSVQIYSGGFNMKGMKGLSDFSGDIKAITDLVKQSGKKLVDVSTSS